MIGQISVCVAKVFQGHCSLPCPASRHFGKGDSLRPIEDHFPSTLIEVEVEEEEIIGTKFLLSECWSSKRAASLHLYRLAVSSRCEAVDGGTTPR